MPHRRLGSLLVAMALALGLPAVLSPPAQAAPPATFVLSGSGFGHGVGMSQYGAYGQALEGRTAAQILQHYYTGTAVSAVTDTVPLRVNLVHAAPSGVAYVRGEALAAGGGAVTVTAGATAVGGAPNEAIQFGISGSQVTVSKGGAVVAQAPSVSITWDNAHTAANIAGPGETFESEGHRYRYGLADVGVVGAGLEVVNEVSLHSHYVRGIAEVPSLWPAEVLKAQAIAARTYALRKQQAGVRGDCRCHVFDGVIDQVFAGYVKETSTGGAQWATAVEATQPSATTGLFVLFEGAPISANYFSSSGGRTENNEDGFGGTPLPYLRGVDDHWSLASYNPKAAWTYTKGQAEVAAVFGLPDVVALDFSARTPGGAVRSVAAQSSAGARAEVSGSTFRSKLGLPARWIRKPVTRISGSDRFGTSVAIGQAAQPDTDTVVLASGDNAHLVDGLVAAPLARQKGAPVLLATAGGLPDVVAAEIDRLQPSTAFLVGGEAVLGPGVVEALTARGVTTVERLAGADRYATAFAVAKEMGGPRDQVVVASGDAGHLVDALAAGGPAGQTGRPIVLASRDAVPQATLDALAEVDAGSTLIAGGPASISDAAMAQLPHPTRVAGSDRFGTAVALADNFSGLVKPDNVVVASGSDANLVDALPGGALGRLMLLTPSTSLAAPTRTWLGARVDIGAVQVLGGPAAVSAATFDAIRAAVGG